MHNVVAAHYARKLYHIQGVVEALAKFPYPYAWILAAQPLHERCLHSIEQAHVDLIAHGAQPRHEVHHQGLGATREQRGYHLQYFHLFLFMLCISVGALSKMGATGKEVVDIQNALKEKGYFDESLKIGISARTLRVNQANN